MLAKNRPLLVLLVIILASLACSRQTINQKEMTFGQVTCTRQDNGPFVMMDENAAYVCQCPSNAALLKEYGLETLQDMNTDTLAQLVCTSPNVPNTNGAAPTEPPTEEPAATEEPPTNPAPLPPFLTGNFSTCDNSARYVNFSIAENAPPYDPTTFKLLFNGYEAKCAPAANNPGILTCNYPPVSYDPPAGIQVFIGEELVNEFDFNGGEICDPVPQPKTNTEEPTEEPSNPAPTEDPGSSD